MTQKFSKMAAFVVALGGAVAVAAPPADTQPSTPSAPSSVTENAKAAAPTTRPNGAQSSAAARKDGPGAALNASGNASGAVNTAPGNASGSVSGSVQPTRPNAKPAEPPKSPAAATPPKSPAASDPSNAPVPPKSPAATTPPKSPAAADAPGAQPLPARPGQPPAARPMPQPNDGNALDDVQPKADVDAKAGVNAATDSPTQAGAKIGANAETGVNAGKNGVNAEGNLDVDAKANTGNTAKTDAAVNSNTDVQVNGNADTAAGVDSSTNAQLNVQGAARFDQALQTRVASAIGLSFAQAADAVTLSTVQPNSVFSQVGLLPGDQIVSISGQQIGTRAAFMQYLYGVPVGQRIPIVVMRNGAQQTLYWTPGPQFTQLLPPLGPGGQFQGAPVMATLTYVPGRRLGIEMDPRFNDRTIVTGVADGSPAEQAGVMVGDQITALNDQPVAGPADFLDQLHSMSAQTPIHLSLAREGDAPTAVTAERVVPQPNAGAQPGVVTPPVIGRDGDPGRGIPGDPRGPIRRAIRP